MPGHRFLVDGPVCPSVAGLGGGVCGEGESGCGEVVRRQNSCFLTQPEPAAPPPCSALSAHLVRSGCGVQERKFV